MQIGVVGLVPFGAKCIIKPCVRSYIPIYYSHQSDLNFKVLMKPNIFAFASFTCFVCYVHF
jgi:hypothetical protein